MTYRKEGDYDRERGRYQLTYGKLSFLRNEPHIYPHTYTQEAEENPEREMIFTGVSKLLEAINTAEEKRRKSKKEEAEGRRGRRRKKKKEEEEGRTRRKKKKAEEKGRRRRKTKKEE
jgi:hypothetical protein